MAKSNSGGYLLAIDQGTTGSTVLIITPEGNIKGRGYSEFRQIYPRPGWVEHDAEEIWRVTYETIRKAIANAGITDDSITAIGITNQRETTVVWDKKTGAPVHNAIVWQCRRTAPYCNKLKERGLEPLFRKKTGLVLDAYFSGTKIAWILDNVKGARKRAQAGELAFGTIDTWLIWKLTGGEHLTDYTNASRTLIFNIQKKKWDDELLEILGIPEKMLPFVRPSSGDFGETKEGLFSKRIPIRGVAGDQQSALFGQLCHTPGMVKNTYGTGCFALTPMSSFAISKSGLITTLACDEKGMPIFALEGSVFIAGAAVQWLRDELKLIDSSGDSEYFASKVEDTKGVYLVPAFVGLGAPYWDMDARGVIVGITRGTNKYHIIRATLESIAYQSVDLIGAMSKDLKRDIQELRVDGGACANNLLMQFQADLLGIPVNRPQIVETTALGVAFLAGLASGVWKNSSDLKTVRKVERIFEPKMDKSKREELLKGWKNAVNRAKSGTFETRG